MNFEPESNIKQAVLPRILLIDDNQVRSKEFEIVFNFLEYDIETFSVSEFASVFTNAVSLTALFLGSGEKQGALVNAAAEKSFDFPVFLLIEKGNLLQVSNVIKQSVDSVVEWPSSYSLLHDLLVSHAKTKLSRRSRFQKRADKGLAGNSALIKDIRKAIDQVARSDATVLVLGESGTGKEVVAQALHRQSHRHDKPFVPVNCGAIPAELLESELFGHEKGAFTGALIARQGRFEMADGGTLFLDEIGDMPMPMQVKLLRVLQERTFERIGSNKTIHCDVRIIAATHRKLEDEIKEGRFREDLYYRLNVFPIELAALRERIEDIPYIVKQLTDRMQEEGRGTVRLSHAVVSVLMQHDWPGNVRELANLIERLAIIKPGGQIEVSDLPEKFKIYGVAGQILAAEAVQLELPTEDGQRVLETLSKTASLTQLPEQGIDLKEYLSDLESDFIKQALNECNGVVAHAAKKLHMRRTTLVEKLRKYDI